ncbi:hypothetical protein [Chryseobacterium sp.]|uniref:hypothetical protein n=1 Tax=Chryseobacterium sp. TaxID=1871047 RepID=UPI002FCA5FF8
MSKITVKRFLNKKIKPIAVYDDLMHLGYPLYYSITYNRKTQYLKSLTGAIMTEKAFEILQKTEKPFNYETNYLKGISEVKLINELEYIKNAVSFIVNENKKDNILDDDFIPKLKSYFNSLDTSLFYIGWLKYNWNITHKNDLKKGKTYTAKEILNIKIKHSSDEERMKKLYKAFKMPYFEIEQLYYSFNRDKNLLHSIEIVENILSTDLKQYFYLDTLKLWYVIDLVIKYHNTNNEGKALKIDFILNNDINKYISLNENFKYPLLENEIFEICKILKFHSLIF